MRLESFETFECFECFECTDIGGLIGGLIRGSIGFIILKKDFAGFFWVGDVFLGHVEVDL